MLFFLLFFLLFFFGDPEVNAERFRAAERTLVIVGLNSLLGIFDFSEKDVSSLEVSSFFLPHSRLEDGAELREFLKDFLVASANWDVVDEDIGIISLLHLLGNWCQHIVWLSSYFVLLATHVFVYHENLATW